MSEVDHESVRHAVLRAAAGDQGAWHELVRRYAPLVWYTARTFLADPVDAADVSQTTWLRLAEHLGRLRSPERLASWLITTTRREALLLATTRCREQLQDPDLVAAYIETRSAEPEAGMVMTERDGVFWRAFATLSERCRRLLRVLAFSPELTHRQVSDALGIPIGSIGPTRGRCLEALRRKLSATGLFEEAAG
jgi:RNA polymerase sigma factor (sigma-70 family)